MTYSCYNIKQKKIPCEPTRPTLETSFIIQNNFIQNLDRDEQ